MDFLEAKGILVKKGYKYYCARMISGYDFDDPEGNQVFLTETEIISLAQDAQS